MSSGNRKIFDDMSASPSNLQEASDSEIEETPNLTGVAEENSIGDDIPVSPQLNLQEILRIAMENPWIIGTMVGLVMGELVKSIVTMVVVAILVEILSWYFQDDYFGQSRLALIIGILDQTKDWLIQYISSIFNNQIFD